MLSVMAVGSPRIGTKDYAREAPILESIDEGELCDLGCFRPLWLAGCVTALLQKLGLDT